MASLNEIQRATQTQEALNSFGTNFARTSMASQIIEAIEAGFAVGGRDEWEAPEFQAARDLTEQAGCSWDFTGWHDTASTLRNHAMLGGVKL